ncbi:glycoside hydrolase family 15 protein [Methanothermococcus okinawensis]|uniref:Glycoside hydrolase 15-related protein n=1 Tax=Methanothermococcus okinawensis (strain DSM 14208 / JCM 11175 / IH1) TaxID=647113 RepID=F8ALJ6_METOI|nr:glycoside hydrolase family 15 protein [Methanothermococcus okinawensis]AEH07153.1 glycoside hydrolase 15-related protein [Methanothermococcus okinawensis IH1]
MVGIIGNGKSLAKLDDAGSIEYMFFPHLGFEKHIFDSAFAIYCEGKLKWHWDYSWKISQGYLKDTNVLKTIYEDDDFIIVFRDYMSISHDVLVRRIVITNKKEEEKKHLKLFFYENLRIGEYPKENTVKFLKNKNCLIKYDGKYVFCIGSGKKISSYQCGIRSSESSAYNDIENGILKEQDTAKGLITDSALCWDIELKPFQKAVIPIYILVKQYDNDYHKIMDLIDVFKVVDKNSRDIYNLSLTYWKGIIQDMATHISTNIAINIKNGKYIDTCKRSLLTILMLCNHKGGIIASPSLYPDYRYVWNRDATYMAVALDLCGIYAMSEKYFDWCKKTQNNDGSWIQNYYINGNPRLTAIQNDQVGTTIWGALIHYRITHDKTFLKRHWNMIKKAANYLAKTAKNLSPCYDLWEEKYGVFAYTVGATYGGLKSACNIMDILEKECEYKFNDDENCFELWSSAIKSLKNSVDNLFYLKEENRFAKSINPLDKTIDTSILGLSFPYNLVPADDPRMIATALQIEKAFNYKIGGIGRYPEDVYFGGNPWIITTLWLYMYYKQLIKLLSKDIESMSMNINTNMITENIKSNKNSNKNSNKYTKNTKNNNNNEKETKEDKFIKSLNIKHINKDILTKEDLIKHCNEKCNELFDWVLENHQYNGLFPEQVHKDIGAPISAIPLGWSHAFVIMAIHNNDYDILLP